MSDTLLVCIISGAFTLVGSFLGAISSHQLVDHRLNKLEEKVDKHNSVIERMAIAEVKIENLEDTINGK